MLESDKAIEIEVLRYRPEQDTKPFGVGEALASGALDEAMLEDRASPDAAALLRQIKGIGP